MICRSLMPIDVADRRAVLYEAQNDHAASLARQRQPARDRCSAHACGNRYGLSCMKIQINKKEMRERWKKSHSFIKVSEEQFVRDWRAATGSSAEEAKSVYANIQPAAPRDQGLRRLRFLCARELYARPARDHPYSDRYPRHDRGRLGASACTRAPVWDSVTACSSTTRSASSTATTSRLKTKDTFSSR